MKQGADDARRTPLWPWFWLGIRLCVGSGSRLVVRTALLGGACAVATVLILGAMAVPVVSDAQRAREAGRTPIYGDGAGVAMLTIGDAVDQRPLLRVAVASEDGGGPVPPGVTALPRPGEIVVSPALHDLLAARDDVRYRFPQREIGRIGPPGLVAPDELVAYVGLNRDELPPGGQNVVAFGAGDGGWQAALGSSEIERMLTPPRVVSSAFAFFLGFPLAFLLAACVRFDATRRDRRLAALRLVGASRRQAYLSTATEQGVVSVVGVAAGLLGFRLLAPHTAGWNVGRFHWYAADVHVPWPRVAFLGVIVVGLSVLVAGIGSRPATTAPIRWRRFGGGPPSQWRLVALAAAPVALALAPSLWLPPRYRLVFLAVGIAAAVFCLATITPVVLSFAGRMAARSRRLPVWALLAARRAQYAPTITPKLISGTLVALFVAGFGLMVGTTVREGRDLSGADVALAAHAEAFEVTATAFARIEKAPGVAQALHFKRLVAQGADSSAHFLIVAWATCATAEPLFHPTAACVDGTAYRLDHGAQSERTSVNQMPVGELVTTRENGGGPGESLPVPQGVLPIGGTDDICQCDILITRAPPVGDLYLIAGTDRARFWADLARYLPGTRFQGNHETKGGFDADAVLTLLAAGLTLTIALAFVAFAVAAIDRGIEARHRDAPLLAIGVPARVLRLADASQLVLILFAGNALGLALLVLAIRSWSGVFHLPAATVLGPIVPVFGAVTGGLALLAMVVVIVTTRSRRLAAGELRRE